MVHRKPPVWGARGLSAVLMTLSLAQVQAQAQATVPWDERIAALVDDQGDAEAAYRLAQETGAGVHPDYGLWRGIAAVNVGRLDEAAPLLEAFIRSHPRHSQLARAELELARTYILTGQGDRAEPLFEAVLRGQPPPGVVSNIQMWRAVAKTMRPAPALTVQGYLEAGFGRDSNPAGGVSAASINLPGLGVVTLDDSSVRRASNAGSAEAFTAASYRLAPTWTLLGQGSLGHTAYAANSALDLRRVSLQAGVAWQKPGVTWRGLLSADSLSLGHAPYRDYLGLVAEGAWAIAPQGKASLTANAGDIRYAGSNASRDTRGTGLALGYVHTSQHRLRIQLSANAAAGRERSLRDLPHLGRGIQSARLALSLQPSARTSVSLTHLRQSIEHQGDDPLLGLRRSDLFTESGLSLAYALSARIRMTASYSALRNRSNAELWAFERRIVAVKLRYQF